MRQKIFSFPTEVIQGWPLWTGLFAAIASTAHGYSIHLAARAAKNELMQGAGAFEMLAAVLVAAAVGLSPLYARFGALLFGIAALALGWLGFTLQNAMPGVLGILCLILMLHRVFKLRS
jgi:hypothetical protein